MASAINSTKKITRLTMLMEEQREKDARINSVPPTTYFGSIGAFFATQIFRQAFGGVPCHDQGEERLSEDATGYTLLSGTGDEENEAPNLKEPESMKKVLAALKPVKVEAVKPSTPPRFHTPKQ